MSKQTDHRGRTFEYGRWYPSGQARAAVKSLAQHWAEIRVEIEQMPDEQLQTLLESIDAEDFKNDNCWWAEYDVIRAFAPAIRREVIKREREKNEATAE